MINIHTCVCVCKHTHTHTHTHIGSSLLQHMRGWCSCLSRGPSAASALGNEDEDTQDARKDTHDSRGFVGFSSRSGQRKDTRDSRNHEKVWI